MSSLNEYKCYTTTSDNIPHNVFSKLRSFVDQQSVQHYLHPATKNMQSNIQEGLLSNILRKDRWTSNLGEICILEYNDIVVGVSCVEHSDIHTELSTGGIRCWLDSAHRTSQLMSKFLLNSNLEWSILNNKQGMMLTFNDYNKIIYDTVKRINLGKSSGFGKIWSDWWKDCIILDKQLDIRNTQQWCVIKPINLKNAVEIADHIK